MELGSEPIKQETFLTSHQTFHHQAPAVVHLHMNDQAIWVEADSERV